METSEINTQAKTMRLDSALIKKIEKLAKEGDRKKYALPRPIQYSKDFDFSFSGLKTAALRLTQTKKTLTKQDKADIAAATQDAVIDVLVTKTINELAASKENTRRLIFSPFLSTLKICFH